MVQGGESIGGEDRLTARSGEILRHHSWLLIGDCDVKLELGHIVLNVRSLDVSMPFYRDVLGMRMRRGGRVNGRPMAFLSFGSKDHDIALLEVGLSASPQDETRAGLRHVAFRIGDRIEQLRTFKKHLDVLGITPRRTSEHRTSWSIYMQDPDGIELEVYVESKTPIWDAEGEIEVTNSQFHLD
jgi:catechol-2,3-dioxygenase